MKVNNLLGKQYPFFLTNTALGSSYFLYQVYSPGINENLEPYVSLTKISERTKLVDGDIVSICIGVKKASTEKSADYVKEMLKKNNPRVDQGTELPMIVLDEENTTDNLIVQLRHSNRWKNYRFFAGRQVDILLDQDNFVIYDVCEDENDFWLEPRKVYKNTDIEMKNPMKLPEDFKFEKTKYSKAAIVKSITEILRDIRSMEWKALEH